MARGCILIEYGGLSPEPTPFPLFSVLNKSLILRGYLQARAGWEWRIEPLLKRGKIDADCLIQGRLKIIKTAKARRPKPTLIGIAAGEITSMTKPVPVEPMTLPAE